MGGKPFLDNNLLQSSAMGTRGLSEDADKRRFGDTVVTVSPPAAPWPGNSSVHFNNLYSSSPVGHQGQVSFGSMGAADLLRAQSYANPASRTHFAEVTPRQYSSSPNQMKDSTAAVLPGGPGMLPAEKNVWMQSGGPMTAGAAAKSPWQSMTTPLSGNSSSHFNDPFFTSPVGSIFGDASNPAGIGRGVREAISERDFPRGLGSPADKTQPQRADTSPEIPSQVPSTINKGSELLAPCMCKGTQESAHGECLDHWRSVKVASPRRRSADIRLVGRHPEVYEPCDDSFALVDALLADRAHLRELQPSLCLEVGCGSGYVITSLALMFVEDTDKVQFLATDISEAAVESTFATLVAHHIKADVVVADLVSGLEERVLGAVDVLVFNPPYVPTPEQEVGIDGISSAWAGGDRGRTIIDRMLAIVDSLLSSKGWFYMVTVAANNPGEICQIMRRKGFASRIVIQRYTEEESLHVLKFWREASNDSLDSGGPPSPASRTSLQRALSQRLSRLVSFK